ncbi:MAG: septum formation initiator family protein [Pseudomonadota bacterium]
MRWVALSKGTFLDIAFIGVACTLATYFAFAAVQGEFGLTRLLDFEAEEARLEQELSKLVLVREGLENKTRRLSDEYLDLDLLDEQARKTLGLIRPDEIILH